MSNENSLKFLSPVESLTNFGYHLSCRSYALAKSFVPNALKPTVESVEKTATDIVTPYANIVMDAAPKALQVADSQVAAAVAYVQNSENAKAFIKARDEYLSYVEQSIEKVKQQTKVDDRLAGLITSLQGAVSNLRNTSWSTYNASLERVQQAWQAFVEHPQVKSVISKGDEASKNLLTRYQDAHGKIVADPRYAVLVKRSQAFAQWLSGTSAYKAVKPVVEPVINRVQEVPQVKELAQHLAPKASAAPGQSPSVAK